MAEEKLLRVVEEDFHLACQCASRKCGPHRCWPSFMGGCIQAGLIVLLLILLSMDASERTQAQGATRQQAIEAAQEAIRGAVTEWNTSAQQTMTAWDAIVEGRVNKVQNVLDQIRSEEGVIQQALLKAQAIQWAVQTPDLERDAQLKALVEKKAE